MSKHTPGPWTFGPPWMLDQGYGMWIVSCNSPDRHRCNVLIQGVAVNHLPAAEAEANAHLIAAAPELMDALEGIANATASSDGFDPFKAAERFQAIARAALAKAKGE